MANLNALKAILKLVADLVSDSVKAAHDASPIAKLADFSNILPDLITLLPQITDIDDEIQALTPADYGTLVASIAADLSLPSGKVELIVAASLKLVSDLSTVIVPDILAIIKASKAE